MRIACAGASPLLLSILRDLTLHLTGSGRAHHQQQQQQPSAPALQQQLYEAAMQVFEREGALSGALTFAQAALHLLQQQQQDADADAADAPRAGEMEVEALDGSAAEPGDAAALAAAAEGRLWSNVFAYSCGLRRWGDAYAALVSNPDAQQALECLRRLVHELCEAGELGALCALPLAGALVVPAAGGGNGGGGGGGGAGLGSEAGGLQREAEEEVTLVTLRAEAVAALQRRAVNSELTLQPQPYK